MICISFQIHNLAILMHDSVVKVQKNRGLAKLGFKVASYASMHKVVTFVYK